MTTELNQDLALAKQLFNELVSLSTIETLLGREYGHGAKRQRTQEIILHLVSLLADIEKVFSTYLDVADATPIMRINLELRDFYTKTLEPNANKLRDIFLDISGMRESLGVAGWEELQGVLKSSNRKTPIANSLSWGLERWWNMLEEGEQEEWLERGFDIEAALNLIDTGYFAPDFWLENRRCLSRPVLLDRPLNSVPKHVQERFHEIYQSFTYGLWMSAIALSRSVSEYAAIDNGPRLGLNIHYMREGKEAVKSFEKLIDEVEKKYPELGEPLDSVRDTGNIILHPKKEHDVVINVFPKFMHHKALKCLTDARLVVESLYTLPSRNSRFK
jgi:hypothetical protein